MGTILTVFAGGDVYGESGLEALEHLFPALKAKEHIDFAFVNGENAAQGKGITEYEAKRIFAAGIDVITGGNHTFEKKDFFLQLESDGRVLRPANYPDNAQLEAAGLEKIPGRGLGFYSCGGSQLAVLNLQGREDMFPLDCPFAAAQKAAQQAKEADALLFVDFHAEANEEKEALAIFLDGQAAAVFGTHTHVQTADERVLPAGTAYITDLGMTGDGNSVIGSKTDITVRRNLTQVMFKLENADGPGSLQGVIVAVDTATGKALSIKRVNIRLDAAAQPEN